MGTIDEATDALWKVTKFFGVLVIFIIVATFLAGMLAG